VFKKALKKIVIGSPFETIARRIFGRTFTISAEYWEKRYKTGGNSGAGSYGRLANFKAEVLNEFVARKEISSVIEFGSGDGNQLKLAKYPIYTGVDISMTAVEQCRKHYAGDTNKSFLTLSEYDGRQGQLSLSLDVIYHLVEDEAFINYMATLFDAAERYVIIYSSNWDEQPASQHVRHRKFVDWASANRPCFNLVSHIPNRFSFDARNPDNSSFADFYIFEMNEKSV